MGFPESDPAGAVLLPAVVEVGREESVGIVQSAEVLAEIAGLIAVVVEKEAAA